MKILITGISGTLGTSFANLLQDDHQVFGIDRNEASVAKFLKTHDIPVEVNDFDETRFKGDLIIHLAAMKHIDLCETNATACIQNNILRTYNLFRYAQRNNIDVLFMSTDKAVEPCSMYGYSKAIIEGMCKENGWAFARSGNILNSNGSVFEFWDEAIKANEPIKLTHKDMRRYFISADNLAYRIWDKYITGTKVIIPDMDMDVKLIDIAKNKIAIAGKDPHLYPIEYIGLRPGEKLVEKLE